MNQNDIVINNPIFHNNYQYKNNKTLQEYLNFLPYPIWIIIIILCSIGILFGIIYLILFLSFNK